MTEKYKFSRKTRKGCRNVLTVYNYWKRELLKKNIFEILLKGVRKKKSGRFSKEKMVQSTITSFPIKRNEGQWD